MLHLMESTRLDGAPRTRWMAASTVMHAAVISTVALTGATKAVTRAPEKPPEAVVFTTPAPPSAPATATERRLPGVAIPRPAFSIPVLDLPIVGPWLRDIGQTRDVFHDIGALPGPQFGTQPGTVISGEPGVYVERTVDRVATPHPRNRWPDYPSSLRAAGIPGEVLVRFIVDTTGGVEPGSIEILAASHELFGDAVRRWLPRTRYESAQVAGKRVRQLVEQRIEFALQ